MNIAVDFEPAQSLLDPLLGMFQQPARDRELGRAAGTSEDHQARSLRLRVPDADGTGHGEITLATTEFDEAIAAVPG
ncbi:MAG: hypothetical protein ACREOS_02505, partial [Candidatus Dormibacteraceae bacterium]